MSTTISLPNNHTARLRDVKNLRERHRRLVLTAMQPLARVYSRIPSDLREKAAKGDEDARRAAEALTVGLIQNASEARAMAELRDAVIVALLESWSIPEALPTIDTIQDLDHELYAALDQATRSLDSSVMEQIRPANFEVTPPDQASPFVSSADSASSSKAKANGATPTTTPAPAIANTATEGSTTVSPTSSS